MKRHGDRDYAVYAAVRGNPVVTVSDLVPGTRCSFKARVGSVSSEGRGGGDTKSKSTMDVLSETIFVFARRRGKYEGRRDYIRKDVTEWGDYSIESASRLPERRRGNFKETRRRGEGYSKANVSALVKAKGEEKQAQKSRNRKL